MKKLLCLMIFLTLSAKLYAGELSLSPLPAKPGDNIEVKYSPDERFIDVSSLKLFAYFFSAVDNLPLAKEFSLRFDSLSAEATTSIAIPDTTVFVLLKVDGEDSYFDIYDDNKSQFWDIIIYGNDGNPLKFAMLKAGISYLGSFPDNFNRRVDFDKAVKLLQKETELYPNNIQAQIGLTSMLFDMKKLTQDDFRSTLEEVVKKDFNNDNENTLRAVTRALRALNESGRAQKMEKEFAEEHPKSDLAEEFLMAELAEASSMSEFMRVSGEYIEKFPKSANREKIYSAIVSSFLQVNKYKELRDFLSKFENVPVTVYSQLALSLATNDKLMDGAPKAERIREATSLFNFHLKYVIEDENYGREKKFKPDYFTETEWQIDRDILRGNLAAAAGELFIHAGELIKASEYYSKALDILSFRAKKEIYENAVENYLNLDNEQKAIDMAEKAIINSEDSPEIWKIHQRIFKTLNPEKYANYDNFADSLESIAFERRMDELQWRYLDMEKPCGVFKTLDGRVFDTGDLTGKVSVINFWATWCGPCQVLMPSYEDIFNTYKDAAEVYIIGINVWEKTDDRAREVYEFLKEKEYNFPVFFDDNDVLPRNIGLSRLPVTVFLDKNGNVQFIEDGYSNDPDYRRRVEDRIYFLLNYEEMTE